MPVVTDKNVRQMTKVYKDRLASIKMFEDFVKEYTDEHQPQIVGQLESLEEVKAAFEKAREKLLMEHETCDEQGLLKDRKQFYTEYHKVKGFLLSKRERTEHRPMANSTMANITTSSGQVRLPKIELPAFSGDSTQWISFKDRFSAMVHEVSELSDTMKLQYLLASLKGDAARLFDHVQLVEENYNATWQALLDRFDDHKILKRDYFKALVDLQPMAGPTAEELTRIVNESKRLIRGMERLEEPVSNWHTPLSSLVRYKFDEETLMAYELIAADQKDDVYTELFEFCEKRIKILNSSVGSKRNKIDTKPSTDTHHHDRNTQKKAGVIQRRAVPASVACAAQSQHDAPKECLMCKANHPVTKCEDFRNLPTAERQRIVREGKWCFNCLGKYHQARFCRSRVNCGICKRRHHTLVCNNEKEQVAAKAETNINAITHTAVAPRKMIWLSTAQVLVSNGEGKEVPARALLDQGSQSNFISERLVQQLRLRKRKTHKPLSGIGSIALKTENVVTATIKSRTSNFVASVNWLVLSNITVNFPAQTRNTACWNIPQEVKLADPSFYECERIDLLIGAELFAELLRQGQLRLAPHLPILLETRLGWIVSGKEECRPEDAGDSIICSCLDEEDLGVLMERLASLEAVPEERVWSNQDEECEALYLKTTHRNEEGRYIVELPKITNFESVLGDSRQTALRRFKAMERRLEKDSRLETAYKSFMTEYEKLGHMTRVSTYDEAGLADNMPQFYLPHHAVWKTDSTTTKCRVVFDASCKSSSGLSLNDILLTGPRLQDDLELILLRFRLWPVAVVADAEKMYRQVLVSEKDRELQRILWRENTSDPIGVYQLNTVTYGTACAPFLAIRTLRKVFEDEGNRFPNAMLCCNDFYVDDLLSGANTKEQASTMVEELSQLLNRGGFCLRKWASNEPEVLNCIPQQHIAKAVQHELIAEANNTISTLGMLWTPTTDSLQVQVRVPDKEIRTKREVLSSITKIYDPLGFLDPVKMKAKLYMQHIWKLKDQQGNPWSWDKELPSELLVEWETYWSQLPLLAEVKIPRTLTTIDSDKIECHIFCDASEKGYGACGYIRTYSSSKEATVRLAVSKSKVAPLAQRLTIARLELCAALLGNKLSGLLKRALPAGVPTTLWTDSMTVWHWINSSHNNWKTFVANRVSKIEKLTADCQWRHVPGIENPADIVSRGIDPKVFIETKLWWSGPSWLALSEDRWPEVPSKTKTTFTTGEERSTVLLVAPLSDEEGFSDRLFSRYSTYTKLRRVVAYCLRYLQRFRMNTKASQTRSEPNMYLSTDELRKAETALCRLAQEEKFSEDLKSLRLKGCVPRTSPIWMCSPYVDKEGVIRVNGRLKNAKLDMAIKYPVVIPKEHQLARMLATHYHVNLLHAGPQLMLTSLRQRFWVLGARATVRRVHRQCVQCFKSKPSMIVQPMRDLPISRVTQARPFSVAGVDYCGPVYIKGSSRKASPTKAYVAVFVCFVTRAVHIELVSNLSTAAFIAALRRFVSRRGLVAELHSDNGTNFRGAANELKNLYDLLKTAAFQEQVHSWSSEQGLKWKFIPPGAPHFGGLWEAAVRSMKRHLRRVLGNSSISYEDMSTLLMQIEACLNSRPITPMSDDPADLEALTPGHFLTGTSMQQVPDVDLRSIPENRLNHWRVTQQRFQHIWERWRIEYLQQLRARSKWKGQARSIKPGMMVIIRDDNVPPNAWPLARITEIHPGKDGIVRVATLRTAISESVKRPVAKLCVLPCEDNVTL